MSTPFSFAAVFAGLLFFVPGTARAQSPKAAAKDTIYKKVLIPDDYSTGWQKLCKTYEYSGLLGMDSHNRAYAWTLDNNSNQFQVGIFDVNGEISKVTVPNIPQQFLVNMKGQCFVQSQTYEGRAEIHEIGQTQSTLITASPESIRKWDKKTYTIGPGDAFHLAVSSTETDKAANISFYRFAEGKWTNDEFPALTYDRSRMEKYTYPEVTGFVIAKSGQPFVNLKETTGSYYLYTLVNGKWEKIASEYRNEIFLYADRESTVYYGTPLCRVCDRPGKLYRVRENKTDSITVPDADITDVLMRNGELYAFAREQDRSERVVYRRSGNEWVFTSRFRGPDTYVYAPGVYFSDSIYFCFNNSTLYGGINRLTSARHTVTQKTYPISAPADLALSADEKLALARFRFLSQEGKLGLCSKTGTTLLYPFFEEIRISKSTEVPGTINFILKKGSLTFTVNSKKLAYPDRIEGVETKEVACEHCNGKGELPAHVERVEIPGAWIPEKTTTTTSYVSERVWNTSSNSYGTVRYEVTKGTTTPGYYAPSTYEYKTVPGGQCNQCNGEKEFVQHTYLTWNWHLKAYEMSWK